MTYLDEQPPEEHIEEHHTDVGATKARQGRYGRPVFWVLTASTFLAVIALVGAWVTQSDKLGRVQNNERPSASEIARYAAPIPTTGPSPASAPAHG
jgi:hypothetical protein